MTGGRDREMLCPGLHLGKELFARALLARLSAESGVPSPELGDDAVAWIEEHGWPGNVRELKSALSHALVMAGGARVLVCAHFPRVLLREPQAASAGEAGPRTRDEILRGAVTDTVRVCDGNLSEAACRLGVARSTLYRMMLDRPSRR